jgi:hypothetical protein
VQRAQPFRARCVSALWSAGPDELVARMIDSASGLAFSAPKWDRVSYSGIGLPQVVVRLH